ncbi:hypothetical protein DB41_FQ00050 [Neochlamydia sp. TUME1]|uniref:hypothetical protein n=1 Tax=Neochlamydia sp. TUME1 TaxID=1478174 RepID=UPI00057E3851|nr:hypothetical protein [Neochlamydia sp. TUME1]KIC76545.1 hypothetical protein DB41_FQ00050 [Neochlamydia sp. TUME1]
MTASSLNGGSLVGLPDYKVNDLIREKIPENTFTSINVQTVTHPFIGNDAKINARKITLTRSNLSVGWEVARAIFLQLFNSGKARLRYRDDPRAVNGNLVASFLGRDPSLEDKDIARAEEELKVIYARCMTITLYISDDCNYLEADSLTEHRAVVNARNAAQKCILS